MLSSPVGYFIRSGLCRGITAILMTALANATDAGDPLCASAAFFPTPEIAPFRASARPGNGGTEPFLLPEFHLAMYLKTSGLTVGLPFASWRNFSRPV
jgi:hypothetical protein